MTRQLRICLALAALSGFVAVAAGAFGAHGVADLRAKDWLRTGAEYQLLHALAVFACARFPRARTAAWFFLVGGTLFSGSLYAMALSGRLWLGAVTPLGGLLLLAGWAMLAWAVFTGADDPAPSR